ncbi:hypothetical protein PUV47_04775 [Pseudovibrio exalbescens]|uniref:hypothetical protein n=1 Tax=Pseudovibrio exalbescens TaxID=197461 RepID=UPI002366EB07|nr:hypothetical protein [Pseudovibrio exalbescens]MDD7909221.1 hypothetical protein [Pseudovibrio exalbescens]
MIRTKVLIVILCLMFASCVQTDDLELLPDYLQAQGKAASARAAGEGDDALSQTSRDAERPDPSSADSVRERMLAEARAGIAVPSPQQREDANRLTADGTTAPYTGQPSAEELFRDFMARRPVQAVPSYAGDANDITGSIRPPETPQASRADVFGRSAATDPALINARMQLLAAARAALSAEDPASQSAPSPKLRPGDTLVFQGLDEVTPLSEQARSDLERFSYLAAENNWSLMLTVGLPDHGEAFERLRKARAVSKRIIASLPDTIEVRERVSPDLEAGEALLEITP